MNRVATAAAVCVALLAAGLAMAQGSSPSPCQNIAPSQEVTQARAALEQDPGVLEARLRLADALTEQQCYDEAVQVLEAGEAMHRESDLLEARLRSARSMMGEQRYIEGVTRAEEGARLERNVLRCKRLGDIAACDEALSARRSDWELFAAKGDALLEQGRSGEALPVYRRAAELSPANTSLQSKVTTLEAQRHASKAPPPGPSRVESPAPAPRVATTARPRAVVYSNEAPAGRTN